MSTNKLLAILLIICAAILWAPIPFKNTLSTIAIFVIFGIGIYHLIKSY